MDESRIAEIVERVVRDLVAGGEQPAPARPAANGTAPQAGSNGIFETPEQALNAAQRAFEALRDGGLNLRRTVVAAMRRCGEDNASAWARDAVLDTGMGNAEDKTGKQILTARNTPGVEDLELRLLKGDNGMHVIDGVPWGVICSITPSTNPTATALNNGIAMVSAGNAVIFCPHPNASRCTVRAIADLNAAIVAAGGPPNLLTALAKPSLRLAQEIMNAEQVRVIAATGGAGVVRAAMETKKKVFAAGPGNPPVIVDATADLERAGRLIVSGASFDNNLPCVAEKVCIAEDRIADELVRAMERHGKAYILNAAEVEKMLPVVLDGEHPRKESIGQDAMELLRRGGITPRGETRLVVALLPQDHPMVVHEQMMPFLPVVRVRDFDAALELAVKVEHGFRHTALLWSRDTDHITRFTHTLNTSIQVINGPSYAWAGDEGEGYATMTVTTPTGEGITSPRTWQRRRHLVYSGMLFS